MTMDLALLPFTNEIKDTRKKIEYLLGPGSITFLFAGSHRGFKLGLVWTFDGVADQFTFEDRRDLRTKLNLRSC
jgi:hypothetical protein